MKVILLILFVVGYIWLVHKYKPALLYKILLGILMILVFSVCGSCVNLYELSAERQIIIDRVADACGSAYIKLQDNKIYIRVNSHWLNIDKVTAIGEMSIEYEGKRIYLGHSSVYSTIKALEDLGY